MRRPALPSWIAVLLVCVLVAVARAPAAAAPPDGSLVVEALQVLEREYYAPVEAVDIRAGAALVVAGLQARGETQISRLENIDRGYEGLEEKLGALGAQVQRVSG